MRFRRQSGLAMGAQLGEMIRRYLRCRRPGTVSVDHVEGPGTVHSDARRLRWSEFGSHMLHNGRECLLS